PSSLRAGFAARRAGGSACAGAEEDETALRRVARADPEDFTIDFLGKARVNGNCGPATAGAIRRRGGACRTAGDARRTMKPDDAANDAAGDAAANRTRWRMPDAFSNRTAVRDLDADRTGRSRSPPGGRARKVRVLP
ncbi:hypothetical protein LV178_03805, partial [Burkholderia mallei]|nr:hypothetical protein [Burkholderia mallei]